MTATHVQFRPVRRVTSYTVDALDDEDGILPLDAPDLGFIAGTAPADPANSRVPALQVLVQHDAESQGDLRIGGADSCEYPIPAGGEFGHVVDALGVLHVRNASNSPCTFHVFVSFAE